MKKQPQVIGIDTDYGCDVGGVFRKHTQHLSNDFLNRIKEQRNNRVSSARKNLCLSRKYQPSLSRNGCAKVLTSSAVNIVPQTSSKTETRKPTCVPNYGEERLMAYTGPKKFKRRWAIRQSDMAQRDTQSLPAQRRATVIALALLVK